MTHEKNMIEYLDWIEDQEYKYDRLLIMYHKDFLKSPPQLGDFIPTNEDGKVIEEPKEKNYCIQGVEMGLSKEYRIYKFALDQVMWKGWEVGLHNWVVNEFVDSIGFIKDSKFTIDSDKTTYNDLITSGVKLERIEKK